VAVNKSSLLCGDKISKLDQLTPAQFILSKQQQQVLQQEMQHQGIASSHIALPVHPWQLQNALPTILACAFQTGTCQILNYQGGTFLSTSSVRSLAPKSDSEHYLKLPMDIYSLGSCRDLPARKMTNGDRGEQLLKQAISLDSELQKTLYLCDESKWWAYLPKDGNIFDKPPRHLAAMVRTYPAQLLKNPDYRLLPMAALGTALPNDKKHFFDDWMLYRQLLVNETSVLTLFKELCSSFLNVNLRLFRLGMMSEIHGQNSVMVWHKGKMQGVVLRDHDSLRVHIPWLNHYGLMDPNYEAMPGKTSILYQETPTDLLFCLQTLGIQVNLRAIIDVLNDCYDIAENKLWQALQQALIDNIRMIGFSSEIEALLQKVFFENKQWPLKLLIKPLIKQAGGAESMPFGQSTVQNPFHFI
jgi:siderophore synthetase component